VNIYETVAVSKNLATEAHEGQFRKFGDDKGKPYIVHPRRIAARFTDPILTSIAWLHDVVEDTQTSLRELQALGLPIEVLYGVKGMTKVDGENYFDFIMRAKENPYARPVKIADIEDNMVSLKEGSLKDKYRLALYILNN
jgi:(p)ppGpp synthase/HD superfamily hydrolase